MRVFETGATRDTDQGKYDYEGFLSPYMLERFGEYMHKNRLQRDGTLRDSDNWQKGIPMPVYIKSLFRHFMSLWKTWRLTGGVDEEHACAMIFNIQGLLHEQLKKKDLVADEKDLVVEAPKYTHGAVGPDFITNWCTGCQKFLCPGEFWGGGHNDHRAIDKKVHG